MKVDTAALISRLMSAISDAWCIHTTGTPLTTRYASPIVSTYNGEVLMVEWDDRMKMVSKLYRIETIIIMFVFVLNYTEKWWNV